VGELFGVVDFGADASWRPNYRSGKHGPGQRASTYLVDAGHVDNASVPEITLVLE